MDKIFDQQVFYISLIGAGLVVASLALMWLLIFIIVRITTQNSSRKTGSEIDMAEVDLDLECKQKAAAAGLAVAVALSGSLYISSGQNKESALSPWQLAHRNQVTSEK
jgi:hypothetical protein